jgi:AcrR family transcriptional regulator
MRSRRESYTEETVAALLACARERFGREGYEAASLEAIARQANVTTGAIYHHFTGKKGLFQAVAEQVEAELLAIALGITADDPWAGFTKAFEVLIDACAKQDVQRIVFLDAPRVIGSETWRAIEMNYAYGAMSGMLALLRETGLMRPYPVELVAPVLLTVLSEASRFAASAPDGRSQAVELMTRVIGSLRSDGHPPPGSE